MLLTQWGSDPQPPDHQWDGHPTEPLRPARKTDITGNMLVTVVSNYDVALFSNSVCHSILLLEIIFDILKLQNDKIIIHHMCLIQNTFR